MLVIEIKKTINNSVNNFFIMNNYFNLKIYLLKKIIILYEYLNLKIISKKIKNRKTSSL